MPQQTDFEVDQSALERTRWVETTAGELGANQARLRIDSFAFTANNITYAAVGNEVGYWKFFPASQPGWGRVPVWGFADVVESAHPLLSQGERIYGYWPMSTELLLSPDRVSDSWFIDAAEHRRELPVVYNQYYRCAGDPGYSADAEDMQSLFRPLFITSFMIDDFLVDNDYFGARQVVLSSASSKTAFGAAFLLHRRRDRRVIGLTSSANREFVLSLGCYDAVLTYDQVQTLPQEAAVYVDIAGNSQLRASIHEHFDTALKFSSAVGYSHLGTLQHGQQLPGPKPQFFFAPTQVQKRERDWRDSGGVLGHYADAWRSFAPRAGQWVEVVRGRGTAQIEQVYQTMLAGQASPHHGHILSW